MRHTVFLGAAAALSLACATAYAQQIGDPSQQQAEPEAASAPVSEGDASEPYALQPYPQDYSHQPTGATEPACIERTVMNRLKSPFGWMRYQYRELRDANTEPRRRFCAAQDEE